MQLPAVKTEHDYQVCYDPDCPRYPCKVYKEGYAAGCADGRATGYSEGYTEGYAAGESDAR